MSAIKKLFLSEKYYFLVLPALSWQVLFFLIPLLFVGLMACFEHTSEQLFAYPTLENFRLVCTAPHFAIIFRSLWLAMSTALFALFAAYPIAYFLAFKVDRFRFFLLFLLAIPFLVNILVQVYAWFFVLDKQGMLSQAFMFIGLSKQPINFLDTLFGVRVVMLHIYLPFLVMPIFTALEKIDYRLVEASLDLGASFFATFTRVLMPLSMPGIKNGFFLVLVTSFGEYIIPILLGGNKVFFVGTIISEYFFIGKDWGKGTAFICISCLVLVIAVLIWNFIFNAVTMRSKRFVS